MGRVRGKKEEWIDVILILFQKIERLFKEKNMYATCHIDKLKNDHRNLCI